MFPSKNRSPKNPLLCGIYTLIMKRVWPWVLGVLSLLLLSTGCTREHPGLIHDTGTLPVMRIEIDERYLWSADSGLYVIGSNGRDLCNLVANFNQRWEYPARVRYYERSVLRFDHRVGFRIKGKCSRQMPMKSIGLYWRGQYGHSSLNHQVFPDLELARFKRLFLRNSGNDFGKTHLKDGSIATIHKDYSNVDVQAYLPCVVYLNDDYWGIHNIREMITPRHFQYHYGVNPDGVDLLEGSERYPMADDGVTDGYMQEVVHFLESVDISKDAHYQTLLSRIDIESYIDLIIINTYIMNTDWPMGNAKWWRDRTSQVYNRWRWVVMDGDWSMDPRDIDRVYIGDLYRENADDDRPDGFFLFNHLINNESFVKDFLARYRFFVDVVFAHDRVERIIRDNQQRIAMEYDNHQRKWGVISAKDWERAIEEMIEFNAKRGLKMREVLDKLEAAR